MCSSRRWNTILFPAVNRNKYLIHRLLAAQLMFLTLPVAYNLCMFRVYFCFCSLSFQPSVFRFCFSLVFRFSVRISMSRKCTFCYCFLQSLCVCCDSPVALKIRKKHYTHYMCVLCSVYKQTYSRPQPYCTLTHTPHI